MGRYTLRRRFPALAGKDFFEGALMTQRSASSVEAEQGVVVGQQVLRSDDAGDQFWSA